MKKLESYRATCAVLGLALGSLALILLLWGMGTVSEAVASKLPERETAGAQAALPEGGRVLWQEDGVPVCATVLLQDRPDIVGDGAGGAVIAWEDYRYGGDSDLFVQRIYSDGTVAWAANGIPISSTFGNQLWPEIISDGAEGAIVVWENGNIYAQRVYSDGAMAWVPDGVPLCTASGAQWWAAVTGDEERGAIVSWDDERDGGNDIYAQRVYSNGTVAWAANGISLSMASDDQIRPSITGDGAGGAIVTWSDGRYEYWDIYAQRVYSDGTVAWVTDGVTVSVASDSQAWPEIVGDGEEGAIIVWEDRRGGAVDIYAQRIYSDGMVAWTTDGVSLCTASGDQWAPVIVSDGVGGAIVTWQDERRGEWDVYAQRVYSDGRVAWATDGIPVAVSSSHQWYPEIASDGAGGAIVAWQGWQGHIYPRAYAQRVRADGTVAWKPNGISLSSTWESQEYPRIAADGMGGAVVAWEDSRDVYGYTGVNIYAQRVGGVTYTRYLPMMMRDGFGGALYRQYLPLVLRDGSGDVRGAIR